MTVEKAIEILSDVGDINRCCAEDAEALDMAIEALKSRPTSRWSRQTDTYHDYYECEQCGIAIGIDDIRNFCPNCGARMENAGREWEE